MKNLLFFLVLLFGCVCTGCKFLAEPEKENIVPKAPLYDFTFELDSALTGDGSQSLPKDKSGFYHLKMWENSFQTRQMQQWRRDSLLYVEGSWLFAVKLRP